MYCMSTIILFVDGKGAISIMILAQNNSLLKPNLDTKLQVNDYQLISYIPPVELIFNHILSLQGKWRVPVNLISLFQGEWLLYSSNLGAFGVSVLPHNLPKVSNLSPQAESVQTREGRERPPLNTSSDAFSSSWKCQQLQDAVIMRRSCYLESHCDTVLTNKWTCGTAFQLFC